MTSQMSTQLELIEVDENSWERILPDATLPETLAWKDRSGQVAAYTYQAGGWGWVHCPEMATFRFGLQTGPVWVSQERHIPEPVESFFWRSVAPFVLQARGIEGLHASAVLTAHGALAFCAISGMGKSSFCCGLMQRGYPMWADDAFMFAQFGEQMLTVPLPAQVRLFPEAVESLKACRPAQQPVPAARNIPETPQAILALCLLQRVENLPGQPPLRIERLAPVPAFNLLLEHAYCFSMSTRVQKERFTNAYLDLVAAVPVYQVRYRSGWDLLPSVLDGVEIEIIPTGENP